MEKRNCILLLLLGGIVKKSAMPATATAWSVCASVSLKPSNEKMAFARDTCMIPSFTWGFQILHGNILECLYYF